MLAGAGTRPAFRGRGIAGAVTGALTGAMFDRGAESVRLEFSGEGSRRVYERLGYRPQGTRLYMRLEACPVPGGAATANGAPRPDRGFHGTRTRPPSEVGWVRA